MKGDDDLEIDTAQTSKRLDGHLALLEKMRKTFTPRIPNKYCTIPCSLHFQFCDNLIIWLLESYFVREEP